MSKSITYQVTVEQHGTEWKLNGKFHREDGPACEYANGDKAWFINDKQMTEQEFIRATQPAQELTVAQIEQLLGKRIKIVK